MFSKALAKRSKISERGSNSTGIWLYCNTVSPTSFIVIYVYSQYYVVNCLDLRIDIAIVTTDKTAEFRHEST